MMALFRIDGLVSGLNTTAILDELSRVAQRPIERLQARQAETTKRLTIYQEGNTRLLALKVQADALSRDGDGAGAFNRMAVTSSDEDVLTASAGASAANGVYSVTVGQLAQNHKLSSASFADVNAALSLSGEILVNGKRVVVETADTLNNIRSKIVQANAGVNASLLSVSANDTRLVLTASTGGVDRRVDLIDANGADVLRSLGFLSSSVSNKHALVVATSVAGPFTIDSSNDQLSLTLSGVNRTVTLTHQTDASGTSLASAIETDVNAAFASDGLKVRVTYDTDTNQLRLQHNGSELTVSAAAGSDARATLGLTSPTSQIASDGFADSSATIGSLLGLSSAPSGTVQINGVNVSVDLSSDSLSTVKSKIDAAGISGVITSLVVSDATSVESRQELRLQGVTSLTDSNNVLSTLGLQRANVARELSAAQDAKVTVDGVTVTRGSNSVGDLISGVTLNLRSASPGSPVTVQVSRDVSAAKDAVTKFVEQFNQLVDFVKKQYDFDPNTLIGGPLLGDMTLADVLGQVTSAVSDPVAGLSGRSAALSGVGLTLDGNGRLTINDATLTAALNDNPDDADILSVVKLFQVVGTTTHANVSFVGGTSATKPSLTGGYVVNVTRVATQAAATAGTAQTTNSAQVETLTFGGALFGGSTYQLSLAAGNTLPATIDAINNDAALNTKLVASDSGGKLALTSKTYGSAGSFTVVSDLATAGNNSGIGNSVISADGADVAGTINGESAIGRSQTLTGNVGNASTEGLQLLITGTTTGNLGTVTVTKGVGARLSELLDFVTDTETGAITTHQDAIQNEVDDLKEEISSLQQRVERQQERLRVQFADLERVLGRLQTQGLALTQQLAQLSGRVNTTNVGRIA